MADKILRLGNLYTRKKIMEEIQALTGELSEELVPKLSIYKHIEMCTFEVVSLLNSLTAPHYQFMVTATLATADGTGLGGSTNATEKKIIINSLAADTTSLSYALSADVDPTPITTDPLVWIERITACTSNVRGTVKQPHDFNLYNGIAFGNNSQWINSMMWFQIGNEIRIWYDSASTPTVKVAGYRQHIPMTADTDKIDLLDRFVPIVINKVAIWSLKQSNSGKGTEELQDSVDTDIQQLHNDYDRMMEGAVTKARNEEVENI